MALQQNTNRIQTTHIGSLPRPHAVLDLLKAKLAGQPYDPNALDTTIAKDGRRLRKEAGRMRHRHRHRRRDVESRVLHVHLPTGAGLSLSGLVRRP